jgi:hypothetical protein
MTARVLRFSLIAHGLWKIPAVRPVADIALSTKLIYQIYIG